MYLFQLSCVAIDNFLPVVALLLFDPSITSFWFNRSNFITSICPTVTTLITTPRYMVLCRTQLQKLDVEVRMPSRL